MQLALNQLAAHLQKGLRPLYTLHGDEPLQLQEAADAIRAAARAAGHSERSVYTVQGAHFDWSSVLAAGGSFSLFADKKLVEIRIPSGKPGKDGSAAIQQLAENAAQDDSTLTIITLPRLDAATKKGAWFGALDANGVTIQIDPIERAALPQWIAQRLARQNQRVASGEAGQRTLQFFADRVEGNLLAAHQEIQKLGLLQPEGELSFEVVEQAVLNVARYDVFKLSEVVLSGNLPRSMRMMRCWCTGRCRKTSATSNAPRMHWPAASPCPWCCAVCASGATRKDCLSAWCHASRPMRPCACCTRHTWWTASSKACPQTTGPATAGKPCASWR